MGKDHKRWAKVTKVGNRWKKIEKGGKSTFFYLFPPIT
jgi:hypothetical protein